MSETLAAIMDISPGQLIDNKFEILRTVGYGGMGRIYEAYQRQLNRHVALKVLHTESLSEQAALRLEREALALSQLNHPNVVSVYGYGQCELGPYLVMEFVPGYSLHSELLKQQPISITRSLSIILAVCDAIGYTHSHAIVHRDLKPDNIMIVNQDGLESVKIIDLGLAKLSAPESSRTLQKLTETNFALGTVHYMSPEQCGASPAVDGRSDVYSIGIILYECLMGRRPFEGPEPMAIMWAHCNSSLSPLSVELGPEVPPGLQSVIDKATAKAVSDRYPTIEAMASDIRLILAGRGSEVSPLTPRARAPGPAKPQTVRAVMILTTVVLLLFAGLRTVAFIVAGDNKNAQSSTKSLTEPSPRPALDYIQEGNTAMRLDQYDTACKDYEQALRILGANGRPVELVAAHVGLAEAANKVQHQSEGYENAQAALDLLDKHPSLEDSSLYYCFNARENSLRVAGTGCTILGKLPEAERYCKLLVERTKKYDQQGYAEACRLLADVYTKAARYSEALKWYDTGLRTLPNDAHTWLHAEKANTLVTIGQLATNQKKSARREYLQAIQHYERSIQLMREESAKKGFLTEHTHSAIVEHQTNIADLYGLLHMEQKQREMLVEIAGDETPATGSNPNDIKSNKTWLQLIETQH